MRTLLAVLLLGVSYVSSLASVQAVAEEVAARTVDATTYRLVEQSERVSRDRQQGTRQTRWIGTLNANESTSISQRPDAGAGTSTAKAATEGTPQVVSGPAFIDAGWVKDCPCDDSCRCIDPAICKNGDCKRNIIVVFSAKWCKFCPRQKAIAEDLGKEGYIVYVIDYDTHRKVADELNVQTLPTTIVLDNGTETGRYVGLTRAEQLKANVKKRADQKDPPKTPPAPYDFK